MYARAHSLFSELDSIRSIGINSSIVARESVAMGDLFLVHFKEKIGGDSSFSKEMQFPCLDGAIAHLNRILLIADLNCRTAGLLLNPSFPRIQLNNNSSESWPNL